MLCFLLTECHRLQTKVIHLWEYPVEYAHARRDEGDRPNVYSFQIHKSYVEQKPSQKFVALFAISFIPKSDNGFPLLEPLLNMHTTPYSPGHNQ